MFDDLDDLPDPYDTATVQTTIEIAGRDVDIAVVYRVRPGGVDEYGNADPDEVVIVSATAGDVRVLGASDLVDVLGATHDAVGALEARLLAIAYGGDL